MTGWAWFWMAFAWVNFAAWLLTVWHIRPSLVICACGRYRMNGWIRVRDETGLHEPDRCQPKSEAL